MSDSPHEDPPARPDVDPAWASLTDQQRHVIARMLEGCSQVSIARELRIHESTITGWKRNHRTFRECLDRMSREMSEQRIGRVRRVVDMAIAFYETTLDQEPAPDEAPEVRAAWLDARSRAADKVIGRLKPFEVSELAHTGGGAAGLTTDEAWERQMLHPEQVFRPHPAQMQAIRALERFVVIVAGIQGGKSVSGSIAFWRRIREWVHGHPVAAHADVSAGRGFFWMIAPNAIIGEVMCEKFEQYAPPGWIAGREGQKGDRTWTLKDGSRVQFRTGEHADRLVARTVNGAWLDEFTLMKAEVWLVSVRGRLAATGGWVIFTGTPRGQNWSHEHIWRKTIEGDDQHDPASWRGFTWFSSANPAVSRDEVEQARRELPPAYFRREWEAAWDAFKGQIFEGWGDGLLAAPTRAPLPRGTITVMGVDWGFAAAGALVVCRKLPGGVWEVIEEVLEAGKLDRWWDAKIAELWTRHRVQRIWCDPEGASRIATLQDEGLPAMQADNARRDGIREVAALVVQRAIRIAPTCTNLMKFGGQYRWKETKGGEFAEEPVKENDHIVDALRYAIYSENRHALNPAVRVGWRGPIYAHRPGA